MPSGLRWGFVNIGVLVLIEGAVIAAAAGFEYLLTESRAPRFLEQTLGGATYALIFLGGLEVVAAVVYLTVLWRLRSHPHFRRWALVLSVLIASPALLDVRALSANPPAAFYWLVPAGIFGLLVMKPHRHPIR